MTVNMQEFVNGVAEKYPKELLQNRLTVEGNIIAIIFKEPSIYNDFGSDISQDVIDISTRLSNVDITAADNKLSVNGTDVALSGSDYVTVTASNNSVNVSLNAEKIQDGGSAEGHEKLATKGYVDEQMGELT